jgi:hypothetical protein
MGIVGYIHKFCHEKPKYEPTNEEESYLHFLETSVKPVAEGF